MTFDLRLDHLGLATTNLESARRAYERLGFTLSTRSMHAGSTEAGGSVVPWGSGNHCAMFENGYFELLGLVDANLPSNVKQMVARYEGLHIVALECASADETYKLALSAGVAAKEPITLERDASFGIDDSTTRRAAFRNVYLDPVEYPEGRFILIEHRTPDVLWQRHLLEHANGAVGLEAVYLVSANVTDTVRRFTALFGQPRQVGDAQQFVLPRGSLWVASEKTMRAAAPVYESAPVHSVAAASIRVKSLPILERLLNENSVRFSRGTTFCGTKPCVWVGSAEAEHAVLQFIDS
ncbi:MAG: putative dioxygenase [Herminiimonas sp.]|nr:putative dioxygenase [Herminiimonas sp.]